MIGDLEQIVEDRVGPAIGCVLAAGRAEARLAGVRDDLDARAGGALVDMAAERRRPARDELADGFDDDRPDPSALRLEEASQWAARIGAIR